MIKAEVKDLKLFENFLNIANKFVQQGQLVITKDKASLFCKNTQDFSTSRLLLDTNSICLSDSSSLDSISVCIRDINALKSSISIIQTVENINNCILQLEEVPCIEGGFTTKTIKYTGKAKFKLITVDFQVIEKYVSKELSMSLTKDWSFIINPYNLDILQNRTNSIVNTTDDVSIYIYPDHTTKYVMVDLGARHVNYMNSIALPISDSFDGGLSNGLTEVAVHESAFRLFNILKVTENLNCFFNNQYNIFFISSEINSESNKYWIKSRLLTQIIKGR